MCPHGPFLAPITHGEMASEPLMLTVAHSLSSHCLEAWWESSYLYFEDCSCYGPRSGPDFLWSRALCSLANQRAWLFLSPTGPVGLTGSCPPPHRHHFFQTEGASSLPSTYFQLSYILHKVNLANRGHSENIFGFEASVF